MSKKIKLIPCFLGIIVGITSIIAGIILQDTPNLYTGENLKFGADFYTEMYGITRTVASTIESAMCEMLYAISALLFVIGALSVCFFAYKLVDNWPKNIKEEVQIPEVTSSESDVEMEIEEEIQKEVEEEIEEEFQEV